MENYSKEEPGTLREHEEKAVHKAEEHGQKARHDLQENMQKLKDDAQETAIEAKNGHASLQPDQGEGALSPVARHRKREVSDFSFFCRNISGKGRHREPMQA